MLILRPCKQSGPLTEQQLGDILKKHDTNNGGRLSKEELRATFQSLGNPLPGWRASRALQHADANNDGLVDEEELKALIQYASKIGYSVN